MENIYKHKYLVIKKKISHVGGNNTLEVLTTFREKVYDTKGILE